MSITISVLIQNNLIKREPRLCASQVFLLGLHPPPCCSSCLWPQIHAKPQKQLGSEAGCGSCVVFSSVCPGPCSHRCSEYLTGKPVQSSHYDVMQCNAFPAIMIHVCVAKDRCSLCVRLSLLYCLRRKPHACVQGTSPTLLVTWWRLAYWYGFAVQFTVLPFHQEYADSGHFTVSDRISTAIRNNLIFYAVLVVSILLLLQLVFHGTPISILLHMHVATSCFQNA